MAKDKSLFHYGSTYNKLIDPLNKPIRDKIVEVIPQDVSVLDIGCGTGLLCYALRREKQCKVVGADLSLRMIEFAKRHNPFEDIQFIHQDATNLIDFQDDSFDYVIASLIIHEMFAEAQQQMVKEAWRVGRKNLFVDSNAPLSWNFIGIMKRFLNWLLGSSISHNSVRIYPLAASWASWKRLILIKRLCIENSFLRTLTRLW